MLLDYIIAGMAVTGLGFTAFRDRARFRNALAIAGSSLSRVVPALCLAIFAAALLMPAMPVRVIQPWIGHDSGLSGVLIASCIGALIPGGPVVSFPIILVFQTAGAGVPQLIALLSGWSVVAVHRVVAFEIPMMGTRFTMCRLIASLAIPPLSGLCALALS